MAVTSKVDLSISDEEALPVDMFFWPFFWQFYDSRFFPFLFPQTPMVDLNVYKDPELVKSKLLCIMCEN